MTSDIEVLIAKLAAIGRLHPQQAEAIRNLPIQVARINRGHDVVMDGNIMTHSCVVLSGMLHRHKTMKDGNRQILSFHPPGDIPDLQSLHLRKVDYTLSATTQLRSANPNGRKLPPSHRSLLFASLNAVTVYRSG